MTDLDWVPGDMLGLRMPAHKDALRAGGEAFLTEAFCAAGSLAPDNRVTRITQFEECPGGSTGRKLLLSVEFQKPSPGLHTDLFVKFSRDFDNPIRDRGKIQMEREVRFALLSRSPDFPIDVAKCFYADYHHETGTGIMISRRVVFGEGGIERHYPKCLDYEMPEPLEHYKVILKALARLAGTHKAGRLPDTVAEQFPFEPGKLAVSKREPFSAEQLEKRAGRLAEFARQYPHLLPENVRSRAFLDRLRKDIVGFPEHLVAMNRFLTANPDLIALCHWNANIDNAFFWRDETGDLHCGLLDWGNVSQMNLAMSIWGCVSAAETDMWTHLDELLSWFAQEFHQSGGPELDLDELKFHLFIYVAIMGLTWFVDGPALIKKVVPELDDIESRFDPRFRDNEMARTQLVMMTTFLHLWQTYDFAGILDEFLRRT